MTVPSDQMVLTNTNIVLPNEILRGSVLIKKGIIADISEGESYVPSKINLEEDYLIPGLIELHTDNLERHCTPRPKVYWPFSSAVIAHDAEMAAAGITTVFDAIAAGGAIENDARDTMLIEAANAILESINSGVMRATHYLHMRCEVSNPRVLEFFEPFKDEPLVKLVSLMDHTPGQRQFADENQLRIYYQGKYGLSENEFKNMIVERKKLHDLFSNKNRKTIAKVCNERKIITATHDDATREHILEAADLGATISEFPTTLEAAAVAHEKGVKTVMGGPNVVRGGSHSGNVSASELAQANVLDALSSDYVPSSLLLGAFKFHDDLETTLPEAITMVTKNPAEMAGFKDRGQISIGNRADLVQVRRINNQTPIARQTWCLGTRIA